MRAILNKLYMMMAGVVMLTTAACVKSNEGLVDDASTNRPFVPYSFSVKTSRDTAKFLWSAPVLSSGKRYSYTVDISTDTLFSRVDLSKTVDTLGFNLIEPTLAVAKKYYARMRVNAFKGSEPSRWYYSESFSLNGENYLRAIRDFEISQSTALIHWYANANTAGVNKIQLTRSDGTAGPVFDVTTSENASGVKTLNGLSPDTRYTLQLFAGPKSKGITSFSTNKTVTYTNVLSSGGDLAAAINSAVDGDVIGLNPGTYTLGNNVFTMTGKSITIRSVSNNPADTKLKLRELDIAGTGAGITFAGLDIDGNYSGTSYGLVFLALRGAATAGEAAYFTDVRIDNCTIHDYTRCLIVGNNGSAVNVQIIKSFTINNSIIYNIDKAATSTWYTMSLEKLLFGSFNITKSTFYTMGAGMFNMSTNLNSTSVPALTIDYCTFNSFGSGNKNLFLDANANKITYILRNSILANSPLTGGTIAGAYRATGSGSVLNFLNNNYFQLFTNATGTPLNLNGLNQVGSTTINLGWTASTTNFSLASLPSDSRIFSASTSGGTLGDPRWAY